MEHVPVHPVKMVERAQMMAMEVSRALVTNGTLDGQVQPVKLIFKSARFSTEIIVQIIEFSKTALMSHAPKLASVMQYNPPNVIRAFAHHTHMSVTILAAVIPAIVERVSLVTDTHVET